MKKLAFCLSFCLAFFGMITFAGCGESDTQITSITITKTPDKVVYTVDQTIDLSGGKFTAKRGNGSTVEFDLMYATPSITRFTEAGTIIVTMTYKDRTSTFEVTVNQATYIPKYNRSITTIYNGQEQPVSLFAETSLQDGMTITGTTYKDESGNVLPSAPSEVGKYTVTVSVDGGNNYADFDATADYTITKADYTALTTNGYLDFVGISTITYGDDFDLSQLWATDDTRTTLGEVPLASQYAENIIYTYYKNGESTGHRITPDNLGKVYENLEVGSYTITARGMDTDNLNGFSQTCQLQVLPKQLVLGEDYDFVLTTDEGEVDYVAPDGDTLKTTVTVSSANPDVMITVVFYGNAIECVGNYTLTIRYGNSINSTDTFVTEVNKAGVYNISFELSNDSNFTYGTDVRNAFRVVIEN